MGLHKNFTQDVSLDKEATTLIFGSHPLPIVKIRKLKKPQH